MRSDYFATAFVPTEETVPEITEGAVLWERIPVELIRLEESAVGFRRVVAKDLLCASSNAVVDLPR